MLREIKEDPAHARNRSLRAEAYEYLGYAYNAMATIVKESPGEARQHTSSAREMFQQSFNILEDLRARGLLSAADTQWAKSIAGEITKCDEALAK